MPSPRAPELFDPVEKDLLRRFFDLKPRLADGQLYEAELPDDAPSDDDEDDDSPEAALRRRDARRGVRMRHVRRSDYPDVALSDAVARICLNAVRERLPSWSTVTDEGLVSARRRERKRPAQVPLLPRYLFSIDWASSGPGFSWPETYHATFIPGFARWVVTASLDTWETWGVADLGIGWFRAREDFAEGVEGAIRWHWHFQRGFGQERWSEFLDAGSVSRETAEAWRREVWPREEAGKDDEETDDDEDQEEAS